MWRVQRESVRHAVNSWSCARIPIRKRCNPGHSWLSGQQRQHKHLRIERAPRRSSAFTLNNLTRPDSRNGHWDSIVVRADQGHRVPISGLSCREYPASATVPQLLMHVCVAQRGEHMTRRICKQTMNADARFRRAWPTFWLVPIL